MIFNQTGYYFFFSDSTVSSGLNALAAVVVEDVVKAFWKDLGEARYTLITKCIGNDFYYYNYYNNYKNSYNYVHCFQK